MYQRSVSIVINYETNRAEDDQTVGYETKGVFRKVMQPTKILDVESLLRRKGAKYQIVTISTSTKP